MKRTFVLLLLMTFIFSCKSDSKREDAAIAIKGKWYWVKQVYRSYTNDQLRNEEIYDDFSLSSYFEFGEGGRFREFSADQNNREYLGTYRIGEAGNKLYIQRDVDSKEKIYTIINLNKSQLIINAAGTATSTDPYGQPVIYKSESEYTLRK